MTAAEALKEYARTAGPKFSAIVKRYLQAGGSNSDHVFVKYLRQLEGSLAPGTVDLHRRTIQAFYRHFRMAAPEARGWRYDPKDARRPALSCDLMVLLITAAKSGTLTARQTALMAMSTTYGMRAGELAALDQRDVDLPGERVYIRTLKGGRPRWCWLPPEIRPYVDMEWVPCTENSVIKTFGHIWNEISETDKPPRTAWHACRRALVRDLVAASAPEGAVARFMRWANGGARGDERMVALYSRPSEHVGADGVEQARPEDEGLRNHDAAVWETHPYLPLWRP